MSASNIIAFLGLIVAVFGLVITIIKEWTNILLPFKKLKVWVKQKFALDISKRKFLLSFGSVVGLLMFGSIGQLVYKFYNKNRCNGDKLHEYLLLNKKSGVIHHKIVCADHLPMEKNSCNNLLPSEQCHIHKSKGTYIAEIISKSVTVEDSYKETLLVSAIKNSPTSTHLYRPLIKMWGKNKEYDKIHRFLTANINYLQGLMDRPNISPRVEKKYKKALLEIKQRQNRAKYLSRLSEIT